MVTGGSVGRDKHPSLHHSISLSLPIQPSLYPPLSYHTTIILSLCFFLSFFLYNHHHLLYSSLLLTFTPSLLPFTSLSIPRHPSSVHLSFSSALAKEGPTDYLWLQFCLTVWLSSSGTCTGGFQFQSFKWYRQNMRPGGGGVAAVQLPFKIPVHVPGLALFFCFSRSLPPSLSVSRSKCTNRWWHQTTIKPQ